MSDQEKMPDPSDLPPAAQRALAGSGRAPKKAVTEALRPVELGGRDGPDPSRYGDGRKGIAVDF